MFVLRYVTFLLRLVYFVPCKLVSYVEVDVDTTEIEEVQAVTSWL